MNSPSESVLLPSNRSQNTSVLWMLFSAMWVGIVFISLVQYWQIPDDSIYDTPVPFGFKLFASALVIIFIAVYVYTLYRMYFRRTSWLTVFTTREVWLIRGVQLGTAILLNFLPETQRANWQSAFVFAGIGWALTSNHANAMSAVFQVAAVAAAILLIAGRGEVVLGTMIYVIAFGIMVAGYVMNNGLIGELMVERGRVRDQAVTEERFRLARDLHDTVGHSMTQITLKAELARRVLDSDPSRAADELEEIEQLSRSLSAQVRHSISGGVTLTLENELERAGELLNSMSIEPAVRNESDSFPQNVAEVFAWCLREGVMNVVKHSAATTCEITLATREQDYVLKIVDNGSDQPNEPAWGRGLTGMEQRVRELAGIVDFAAEDSGHTLEIRIPA